MTSELPDLEPTEPTDFPDRMALLLTEWLNAEGDDGPTIVDVAVVVWEQVRLDEDGDAQRKINYATLTYNGGLASTAGLLDVGREVLSGDMFDDDDD